MYGTYGQRQFYGRTVGYGDTSSDSSEEGGSFLEVLGQYAPVVSDVVGEFTDPCKQASVLAARLQNARAQGLPATRIRVITAKLEAAQAACRTKRGEQTVEEGWRNLAAVGIGGVVLVAAAGAFYLVVSGLQKGRR